MKDTEILNFRDFDAIHNRIAELEVTVEHLKWDIETKYVDGVQRTTFRRQGVILFDFAQTTSEHLKRLQTNSNFAVELIAAWDFLLDEPCLYCEANEGVTCPMCNLYDAWNKEQEKHRKSVL